MPEHKFPFVLYFVETQSDDPEFSVDWLSFCLVFWRSLIGSCVQLHGDAPNLPIVHNHHIRRYILFVVENVVK